LPYERLHEVAVELEKQSADAHPPTYWFELALRSAEKARNEERRGSKAGQYVAYMHLAIAYQKCTFHKRIKEARAADHAWNVRVTEFKNVSHLPPQDQDCADRRHTRARCARPRSSRRSSRPPP
jgi:hypothetical protein